MEQSSKDILGSLSTVDYDIKFLYRKFKEASELNVNIAPILTCNGSDNLLAALGRVKDLWDRAYSQIKNLDEYQAMTDEELEERIALSEIELRERKRSQP